MFSQDRIGGINLSVQSEKDRGLLLGVAVIILFFSNQSLPTFGQESGSIIGWGGQVNVAPSELTNVLAVEGGGGFSLALRTDGSVVAWGNNEDGQCSVPSPNGGFSAIAAGGKDVLQWHAGQRGFVERRWGS